MSYSQLVLSERPYGYWDCSSIESGGLKDLTSFSNNALLTNVEINKKPIIYGPGNSIRLSENSEVKITNIYKLFFSGSESKDASIEFFFSIKDSANNPHQLLTIGQFLNCYILSNRIYIEVNGIKASVPITRWDSSQYVCIIYGSKSVSINLNESDYAAINLGDSFSFLDSTPPDIVFGPSAGSDKPIYLNSIAIYSYSLIFSEMLMRRSWASYSSRAEMLAISNNADIINASIGSLTPNFSYDVYTEDRYLQGSYSNIEIDGDIISTPKEPPVSVSSLDTNPQYSIDLNGISTSGQSYINLLNAFKYFNGQNSLLRMQVLFDGQAAKQTIFHIGPFIDRTTLEFYKSESNTIVVDSINNLGVATKIYESSDLGSDFSEYFDLAISFVNNNSKVFINDIASDPFITSSISSGFDLYLLNSFEFDSPLTSKLKNFTIQNYSEGDEIIYTNTDIYTLKFNKSFSVSQRGTWSYQLPIPENSVSSLITYNSAEKNCLLYVNDNFIEKTTIIPKINYDEENVLTIDVELLSEDSFINPATFSGLSVSTYDSMYVPSSNGRYRISPLSQLETDTYVSTDPFIIRYSRSTALDRPENLGIKFSSYIETQGDYLDDLEISSWVGQQEKLTSGASLIINETGTQNTIKAIEFLIQLDRVPAELEKYTIFDINNTSIYLKYSSSGIEASSGYSLYVDGQLVTATKILEEDEFYHFLVYFDQPVSEIISLGINNERTIGMDGSMGFFAIHNQQINNVASYVLSRYNAIIGRPYISKLDSDSVNISDTPSSTQEYEYSEDGKYFAMKYLPKIKIIQNKWQTIK